MESTINFEIDRTETAFTRSIKLGAGSFGNVYLARCPQKHYYAVKQIPLLPNFYSTERKLAHVKAVANELEVMKTIRSNNCENCLGLIACNFDYSAGFLLLTDYCNGGSLQDLLDIR